MKRSETRHYTEEELLLHVLGEEHPETTRTIDAHLKECSECAAVLNDYAGVRDQILRWQVDEPPEDSWRARQTRLLEMFRHDQAWLARKSLFQSVREGLRRVWDYALDNPLPTMGYIAAAVAFASERTITIFRLDRVLPNTNEVLEILRQAF
jgi:anti-sigma factor RsiW